MSYPPEIAPAHEWRATGLTVSNMLRGEAVFENPTKLSDRVEVAASPTVCGERGVLATAPVPVGGTILTMGGRVIDIETHNRIGEFAERYGMDISENLSFCPMDEKELERMPQCLVNHSCDPNAGFADALRLVAIRDIAVGEEIVYDYAFLLYDHPENNHEFTMRCECGSRQCRGTITVRDWMIADLQKRFARWFQPFLQARFPTRTTDERG